MGCIRIYLQKMRRRIKLDRLRELGRQYPVFCFLMLLLLLSTVLLNRYVHYYTIDTASHKLWSPCFYVFSIMVLLSSGYILCFYRYIHIMMVFWSFLAGVVTFYCSLGPESLLPNILVSIKPKTKVGQRAPMYLLLLHSTSEVHSEFKLFAATVNL